jgi:hypothetical protein
MDRGRLALGLAVLLGASCRQDMHNQPRYKPLAQSTFFGDERSARPLIPGTVARGHLREDSHLYTGKIDNQLATTFPFPVTREVLEQGKSQFQVFCTPCHGQAGRGNGMVVQRGFKQPPSFHIERLRQVPVGYLFDVMTNGFGAMADYSAQVPVRDRWAIAAYIRALQYSQSASLADVPESERARLESGAGAPTQEPR